MAPTVRVIVPLLDMAAKKRAVLERAGLPDVFENVGADADGDLLGEMVAAFRVAALSHHEWYFLPLDGLDTRLRAAEYVSTRNERLALGALKRIFRENGVPVPRALVAMCTAFIAPQCKPCLARPVDAIRNENFASLGPTRKMHLADVAMGSAQEPEAGFDPEMGLGVVLDEPVAENELCVSVPRDRVIDIRTALASETMGPILAELRDEAIVDHDDTIVMLFVLSEKLRGDASPWAAYFSLIPAEFYTTLTFSDDELALLETTPLAQETAAALERLREHYDALFPALSERYASVFPAAEYTWANFLWVRVLFDTRAMEITVDGKAQTVLVPLADMMNHEALGQISSYQYEAATDSIVFRAFGDVPPGCHLCLHYGSVPTERRLLYYGFLEPDATEDSIMLDLEMPDFDDPMEATLKGLLVERLDLGAPHFVGRAEPAERLRAFLRIINLTPAELAAHAEPLLNGSRSAATPCSDESEEAVSSMMRSFADIVDMFPTSVDEDAQLLAAPEALTVRARLAIQYRMAFKEMLLKLRRLA